MAITKVVCYKNRPAVIISESRHDLPTFVATVMYFIEEDNTLQARIDTIYDRTLLTDYHCPYANEATFPIIHCRDDGKCMYPATPTKLSSMCVACKAESMTEFLRGEDL